MQLFSFLSDDTQVIFELNFDLFHQPYNTNTSYQLRYVKSKFSLSQKMYINIFI